jgi:hypothetical protein
VLPAAVFIVDLGFRVVTGDEQITLQTALLPQA